MPLGHIIDLLTDTMIHAMMIKISHALICPCFICIDCCTWDCMVSHKAL